MLFILFIPQCGETDLFMWWKFWLLFSPWIDLQNVNITLRILFRPITDRLPNIYNTIGTDYDERILPSIVNEVLKAVVVSGKLSHLCEQMPSNL